MREKMIELIAPVLQCLPWGQVSSHTAGDIADRLIANGVVISNLETATKWIPVTERLPEMHKVVYEDRCEPSGQGSYLISHTVLVYSDDGTIGTGTYEEGVTIGWNADTGSDNVTHWMPLPEPPKGE